jgi:acyl carrier protein
MDTFSRVKRWLAATLEINEEVITPQSTLGELLHHRPRSTSSEDQPPPSLIGRMSIDSLDMVELIMAFEEEFDLEFPDVEAEALTRALLDQSTAVQQIVDLIDGSRLK